MTKEVAKAPDQSILDALKQGSGEAENSNTYIKIPYITINNQMVEAELKDGKKVEVRCDPEFMITNKEDKEYTTTPFMPEFNAVILKFKHKIKRKFKEVQVQDFFHSIEFPSFGKTLVHVIQNNEFMPPMTYQECKTKFGDELELWSVAYILIEGEDTVRKVEVKGASRSVLFDYMTSKKEYPTASYLTKFSLVVDTEKIAYNKLVLESISLAPNLEEILVKQTELNKMLDDQSTPNVTNDKPLQLDTTVEKAVDTSNIDVDKMFD